MPRPDLSHILPEQKLVVIAQYQKLAEEDSAHYSPLQCAAYNETSPENARLAVLILIEHYESQGEAVLKEALSYAGGDFGEHILHIAMKYPDIFMDCCDALERVSLLEELLLRPDGEGDTVMHQLVEYGRLESFQRLVQDPNRADLMSKALEEVNHHSESANDLLDNFEKTVTIQFLLANNHGYLAQFERVKAVLPEMRAAIEENLAGLRRSFSY